MWHMNLDQMFTAAFTDTNTSSLACVTVPIYPPFAMSSSLGGTALVSVLTGRQSFGCDAP